MGKMCWEHYSHPADIGIRGIGQTKEQAFGQAALALTAIITHLQKVVPEEAVEISCQEQDDELLFASWLNALIYEMATRGMLFSRFEVNIRNHQLSAKAWGEKLNVKKHRPAVEVKAATYSDLKVQQNKNGSWLVQCIVDV
jgi:tRNA nucleotidyltransferase (CCA-adding enzyme)